MKNPIKEKMLAVYGKEPTSLDELAHCILATLRKIHRAKGNDVVGFAWNVNYDPKLRITHSAPYGAKQQWSRKPDEELRTHPGYHGRVWIRTKDEASGGYRNFSETLSYPGSGGYGMYGSSLGQVGSVSVDNDKWKFHCQKCKHPAFLAVDNFYSCSWDYQFYNEDWPELKEVVELQQAQLMNTMASKNVVPVVYNHTFKWEDEETQRLDAKFAQYVLELQAAESLMENT